MRVNIEVQQIDAGLAKCIVAIGERRVPVEIDCSEVFDLNQFKAKLAQVAESMARRVIREPSHARLRGVFAFDVAIDVRAPRPPRISRDRGVVNIETFGATRAIIVMLADRELTLFPNRQGSASIAGLPAGPLRITAVSADGVPSEEVIVP